MTATVKVTTPSEAGIALAAAARQYAASNGVGFVEAFNAVTFWRANAAAVKLYLDRGLPEEDDPQWVRRRERMNAA